jgi:hypothetical protein
MGRDPEPLEPDVAPAGLIVEPVRGRRPDSRLNLVTGFVAVLVALAVLKPWGTGIDPGPSRVPRRPTPPPVTPIPTQDRTAEGLASPICLGAGTWQVASLETWRTQDVRAWRVIEPAVNVSGPLDPAIPSVPIVAIELGALGWCAPAYGPNKPIGPAIVEAWLVRDGGVERLGLRQLQPRTGETPIAALYVPTGTCAALLPCPSRSPREARLPWTTSRVVFHYRDVGTGVHAWFAADLVITPFQGLPASPLARLSPAPNQRVTQPLRRRGQSPQ